AGMPPARPKAGRATPHLFSSEPCAASEKPPPPHLQRLPGVERTADIPAGHGDGASRRLRSIFRGRFLGLGSWSRRAQFLPREVKRILLPWLVLCLRIWAHH